MTTIEKIGLSAFNLAVRVSEDPRVWKYFSRVLWIMCLLVLLKTIKDCQL
jgi:hypothetical protein